MLFYHQTCVYPTAQQFCSWEKLSHEHQEMQTGMFTVAPFTMEKKPEMSQMPLKEMNKIWCSHMMENNTSIKITELM